MISCHFFDLQAIKYMIADCGSVCGTIMHYTVFKRNRQKHRGPWMTWGGKSEMKNEKSDNTADSAVKKSSAVNQVSLLQSLTLGDYNGSVSVRQVKEKGDIGIGTFDRMNGELIMLDGVVYRALAGGNVEAVSDEETVPFCDAAFFETDDTETAENIESFTLLLERLDEKVRRIGENRFYVIRIDGIFREMNVRSIYAQKKPYRPLVKVLETDQTFSDYKNTEGTVVGLYCPVYMKDLNAVGWHMHYISRDRTKGGHVLGLNIEHAEISWSYKNAFSMVLPDSEMFAGFDFSVDQSEDIRKAETNASD